MKIKIYEFFLSPALCIDIQLYYFDYLEAKMGLEKHEYFGSSKHGGKKQNSNIFLYVRKKDKYGVIRNLTIPSYRCFIIS